MDRTANKLLDFLIGFLIAKVIWGLIKLPFKLVFGLLGMLGLAIADHWPKSGERILREEFRRQRDYEKRRLAEAEERRTAKMVADFEAAERAKYDRIVEGRSR